MQKPKIIVCATAYHPFVGGAEIAIAEIAQRLSARFDFLVLTARMSRALPRLEVSPEAAVIRLGIGARIDKWLLPFLIPWHLLSLSDLRPPTSSLLLWGMDIGQGALGAATAKFFYPRIPFVLTVQYGEDEARLTRGRLGLVGRAFRLVLGQADFVTAISSYLLEIVRGFDYCGPAAVVHNGADIEKFKRQNAKDKTKNQNSKCIVTVSRLVPKNGIDVLIRAFSKVKEQFPEALLHIIGDGPERRALELQAADQKLQANIEFLGEVPHTDLPRCLHEADVFVRPSRSEGMGNAFVEAMAAGLPVIGTPVGGITDIIEDGKTGLFAGVDDPEDLAAKIIRLLQDSALSGRLAEQGRKKAEHDFSWDKISISYGDIFDRALSWRKRTLIAAGIFPPEIGGPATYAKLLADSLPQREIAVRVVPFRAVRRFPKIVRHLVYFWKIVFACRGNDIIFAQDPVSVGFPALLAARILRKKFLLKIVGDYAWEQHQFKVQRSKFKGQNEYATLEEFQKGIYSFATETRRAVQKFVARGAGRVIVPSEYLKKIVVRWGVPEEKISVIHNAFAPPRLLAAKAEARAALGIATEIFLIVSAGRLVPWKGFSELIGAMGAARREIPQARLVIMGSGPDKDALRKNIADGKAGEVVSLAGAVPHEDMLRHLRAADLFVLNSSYEGFSHTLLEALAMGAPVMAADAGGNKEIIMDGVNGRLYQRRDAASVAQEIIRLCGDADLRERFAREAKIVLRRFSKEAMLASTAEIIFSL